MFPLLRKRSIPLTRKKRNDKVPSTLQVRGEFSREFLEETRKVWQPLSPTPLSLDDAKEISENMVALVQLINELGEGEK